MLCVSVNICLYLDNLGSCGALVSIECCYFSRWDWDTLKFMSTYKTFIDYPIGGTTSVC